MEKARQRALSPSDTTIRVFMADDHQVMRECVSKVLDLEENLEIIGEAAGARDAIAALAQEQPDLLITDLSLGDGSGLELIKDVQSRWPAIKVLVMSMHTEPSYAERALRSGALGYVSKEQPTEVMIEAIRSVLRDKIYISPDLSDTVMHRALTTEEGTGDSPVDHLSDRELQVFEMIGDGLTTRSVAERLTLSIKTIETYRDNIKKKLGLENSNMLVHQAVRYKLDSSSNSNTVVAD